MSNTGILQIRANDRILTQARKRANLLGYPSLQQIMRIFLNSFALGKIEPAVSTTIKAKEQFPDEYIKLGPKAVGRWKKIEREAREELEKGNYFIAESADELFEHLEE